MGNIFNIESELYTNARGQKFALDTNVLYWMFYDKCNYSNEKRQKKYQNAVTKLKLHNDLFVSPLSLYELFVIIEKNEYKIYCSLHHSSDDFKLKDYRDSVTERNSVQKILDITYKTINQFAHIRPQTVHKDSVSDMATSFSAHQLDVFDKALTDFCRENSIANIITDDKDYRTVADQLNIYTANPRCFK